MANLQNGSAEADTGWVMSPRFHLGDRLVRRLPSVVTATLGLLCAVAIVAWTMSVEIRSVDRQLDIAAQTLVEEVHGELDEVERDLRAFSRLMSAAPPWGPAEFGRLAADRLPQAEAAWYAFQTPQGLVILHSTEPETLATGADPEAVAGWKLGLRTALRGGTVQHLPGEDGRLYFADAVGSPSVGAVIMAVDLAKLVEATGVAATQRGPTITFRELAEQEDISTSEPLIHKEYLLVGGRAWQFDVTPRAGTPYTVNRTLPVLAGMLALVMAIAATFVTELLVRRRRLQGELAVTAGLNADKDRFLLALSHQIRTPLTAVVGFLDVLRFQDDLTTDEIEEFVEQAADQAAEVAAIVRDILVVTRDDLDLLVVTAEPTNAVREAHAVVASLPRGALSIDIQPPAAECPLVIADPVRLRQIVRNLVGNAARHGGDSIHISVHRRGEEVVVSVADDGPGLPAEVAEQLHASGADWISADQASDSLRLGLRVAWLLAERMRGRIEYRRSGPLTVFELILPAPNSSKVGEPSANALRSYQPTPS